MIYQCENCHHQADGKDLRDLDTLDIASRMTPGYPFTDKECSNCEESALCYPLPEYVDTPAPTPVKIVWGFSQDDVMTFINEMRESEDIPQGVEDEELFNVVSKMDCSSVWEQMRCQIESYLSNRKEN